MAKKIKRKYVLEKLSDIAFGRANDAVKLAFAEPEGGTGFLDGLDLTMLAEVKRGSGGAVEVKLLNRLDALKLMIEAAEPDKFSSDGARSFFDAMDEAARVQAGVMTSADN